jgi:beta-glucanase (GH16 family)
VFGLLRKLSAVALGLALMAGGAAGCSTAVAAPPAVHWAVTWQADFSGPYQAAPPARAWRYDTGHGVFGNGEIETMTTNPGNVYLDGHGNLDITAVGTGSSWSSGRIETTRLFAAPAGGELQVSASIRQPDPAGALGYWPAFWMLGRGVWPEHGEIDILEDVNGLSEHSGTLHCGNPVTRNADGSLGPCHEYTGLSSGLQPCPGCQAAYHSYSVIIDRRVPGAEQVRWYLDGREYFSVSESAVGAADWTEAVDNKYAIILDIAMGGSYPDNQCRCSAPTAATTAGGTMSVRSLTVSVGTP